MVNGVESCREIEKTQTRYFLRANSINQMIMYLVYIGEQFQSNDVHPTQRVAIYMAVLTNKHTDVAVTESETL